MNTIFKCVAELIRTYAVYSDLSDVQIKTLVLIIKANLSNFAFQSNVFMCLRSLITRRFLSADIYDLMETVEDMMVTCVQKNIKTTCASIFIQFILEYPLEEKRLE